ncbi:MAG: PIG-L deacetylase family protein [Methanobacterium sp.]
MNNKVKYGFLTGMIIILIAIFLFGSLQANPTGTNQTVNNTTSSNKVAIILPHPDDETIGMGGNIQILKANGSQIHCVLMTSGNSVWSKLRPVKNYYNVTVPQNASQADIKKLIREDSFKEVMDLWGLDYEMKGLNDGGLTADMAFNTMEDLYLKDGYTEFYTVTGDGDSDHRACYEGMKRMMDKYPNLKYREFPIYYYHYSRDSPLALTNNYIDVDVSKYVSQKKAAFQVYYNINTIIPAYYPYSDGLKKASPERIYYIN